MRAHSSFKCGRREQKLMAHRDYLHKWEQDSENGKTLWLLSLSFL